VIQRTLREWDIIKEGKELKNKGKETVKGFLAGAEVKEIERK
jgi:hypothetical protein